MKLKNYVVTVVEKAKGVRDYTAVKVTALTMGLLTAPTVVSYASDTATSGSYLLAEVMESITNAFSSLAITATAVIGIAVVTGCGIIGMSQGAKYAMKKIKGLLAQAA